MDQALVILCGGKSTRMGTDKALLPFGDYCLIEYLVSEFSPYFSKIYLSVNRKGDYAHLNLLVTEIPDLYANAGPMSGIFSALSMIDEDHAFFMSVDTPFLEPQTGIKLLESLGDADISTLSGPLSNLETPTGVFSKACITTIGKCLLLRQLTFKNLYEKCKTVFVSEDALADTLKTPIALQYFSMETRADYYHALRILSGLEHPTDSNALIEYFDDKKDLFTHNVPAISFVSKPGTITKPLLNQLAALLEKSGYRITILCKEDQTILLSNLTASDSLDGIAASLTASDLILMDQSCIATDQKIEVLKKGWSETPTYPSDQLIGLVTDFNYKEETALPVFDSNRPRSLVHFLRNFVEQNR